MKYKNIFFDFDGVIAESVNVKTEAFYKLYVPYGKIIADKVVIHHKNNGGMSRFEKFKHYHKEYLNIELTEWQVQELANRFSELVMQGVIKSSEVDGIRIFLQKHSDTIHFWVITGTPTEEIREIISKKKLSSFFVDAFGSPEKKDFWVAKIVREKKLIRQECLFIGDALADYQAAITNKIDFALKNSEDNKLLFKDIQNIYRFTDFFELEKILLNHS